MIIETGVAVAFLYFLYREYKNGKLASDVASIKATVEGVATKVQTIPGVTAAEAAVKSVVATVEAEAKKVGL